MYSGMYQSGARFSLGQATDPGCVDPFYAQLNPSVCSPAAGSGGGGGIDVNSLIQTILNDVTQIIKPGTPQIRPVYTPTSTAVTSLFNNPVVLIGGALVVFALASRRRGRR